jgi:hypothetical protein
MHCKKCGGLVYADTMYANETFTDLSCLMCGKRWHIKKSTPLGRYVRKWLIKDFSSTTTFTG